MKKCSLSFVFILAIVLVCNSQDERTNTIERLEAKFPTLQGKQLVDTLIRIARMRLDSRYDKWDSALYYSRLAINEAKKIHYQSGIFRACLRYGDGNLHFKGAYEREKSYRVAIQIANDLKNDTMVAVSTRKLGQA